MIRIIKYSSLVLALLVTGCVSIPDLQTNPVSHVPDIKNPYSLSSGMSEIQTEKWWETFNDPQLNMLVEEVLKNNSDMTLAELNVEKAEHNVSLAKSNYVPEFDLNGSVQREKLSSSSLYPPPIGGSTLTMSQLDVSTSYTFDFFGKFDAMIKEANAQKQGLILKQQYMQLNLANQTVKFYAYWQYLQLRKSILVQTVDLSNQVMSLQKEKLKLGTGLPEDILSAQNDVKNAEVELAQNEQNIQLTQDSLQVLLGNFYTVPLRADNSILNHLVEPVSSVSANSIKNRPDVAYYLTNIDAQQDHLKSLKSYFYPAITISGDAGFQKIGLKDLIRASNIFTTVGPAISLPIFDSGRIKTNYKIAGTDLNIFIEQYNQAVLKSFYDVNDNLYKTKTSWSVLSHQTQTFENQTQTYELYNKRFALGTVSLMDWDKNKINYLNAKNQNISNRYDYLSHHVDLILALGGVAK